MLMGLFVLLLLAAAAYGHFKQGLFSATLSAIFSVVAAVVAFGFHEWVVRSFLGTYVPDMGNAIALVLLFALVYIILRVLFDKYVPGNLTFPLMVDRVGGAAMGLVAGVFATGVLMIAAQTLPFGPSIGGYSRFAVAAQPADASVRGGGGELTVNEVLQSETLSPAEEKHLLLPVDDIVVNVASHLSENGSLAGPQTVSAVHPSYLNELFYQRLGVQGGAKRVAINSPGKDAQVDVKGLYSPLISATNPMPQTDGEVAGIPGRKQYNAVLQIDASSTILIVRVTLSGTVADPDGRSRLSPAAARLMVKGKNLIPIGTLDMTTAIQLRRNQPDDFIVTEGGATIDLVYLVPNDGDLIVPVDTKAKNGPLKLAPGAFLEVKRFADVELNMTAKREMPPLLPEKTAVVIRKKDLPQSPKAIPIARAAAPVASAPGTSGASATPAGDVATGEGPFEYGSKKFSSVLPVEVNVGAHNGDGDVTFPAGSGTLKDEKFVRLELKPSVAMAQLSPGDNKISEFEAGPDLKTMQIIGTPLTKDGANVWEWADKIGQLELVDTAGRSYNPRGVWIQIKMGSNFEDRIIAKYDAESDLTAFAHGSDRPTDLRIIFVTPSNAKAQSLKFDGKVIVSLN